MESLGLVKLNANTISASRPFMKIIEIINSGEFFEDELSELIITKLIFERRSCPNLIKEFLSFCSPQGYEIELPLDQRLRFSGLRNLLIELDFLSQNEGKRTYQVSEHHALTYLESIEPVKLSRQQFEFIHQARENFGRTGELEILKYEQDRLAEHPDLISKIQHVAETDIGAGYDIRSFTIDPNSKEIAPRFIEVKVVSLLNYRFFWTRNEIAQAKDLKNNYYLYLLPVRGKNFAPESLQIIQNPLINICNNHQSGWAQTIEVLSFSLTSSTPVDYLEAIRIKKSH